jgi:hypothetical protein
LAKGGAEAARGKIDATTRFPTVPASAAERFSTDQQSKAYLLALGDTHPDQNFPSPTT